jgi:hypothetical protein
MKSSMDYGTNTYGNVGNAPSDAIKLVRRDVHGPITISFQFDRPAEGRGVGGSRGQVKRVELELPRNTAQALSHALQLALSDTASSELAFQINETAV